MDTEVEFRFQIVSFVVVSRENRSRFRLSIVFKGADVRCCLLCCFKPRNGFFDFVHGVVEISQLVYTEWNKLRVQLNVLFQL